MTNLYTVFENFTNGYLVFILYILSIISITSAILVITSKNPVVSVLFLIGLFLSIACYLLTIGINFIGMSYLLVYIGAVSILFLFILMLINIRVSELITENKNSVPLVLIITLLFENVNYIILPQKSFLHNAFLALSSNDQLNIISYNNWENNITEFDHITALGNVMYTVYAIWLVLAAIILLLAMVGAIVITIKQKNIVVEVKNIEITSVK